MPELAIQTSDGVKVADVVWMSDERFDIIENEETASIAPELCIEIKSASNTKEEMNIKKDLYLEAGAQEFWVCNQNGNISFFNQEGELNQSLLVPNFPHQIRRKN
jgi:Uma2 family endonuclease